MGDRFEFESVDQLVEVIYQTSDCRGTSSLKLQLNK